MRSVILGVGLLVSTNAFAFPIPLTGAFCEVTTGVCGTATAQLDRGGRGVLTVDVLGTALSGAIRWRTVPGSRTVQLMLGTYVLTGALAGGCATGRDTVPTPPVILPLLGPTMTVDWTLCR